MFQGTLRPYQIKGVDKMLEQGWLLLAVHMGGGKTPMTVAAIEDLRECGDVEQGLIVCSSSLKYQWEDEIKRFSGEKPLVIDGDPATRRSLYRLAEWGYFSYIIAGYEQVRDDPELRRLRRDFVVVDEATVMGSTSARAKKLKKLEAPFKFGLTGTPIENHLIELFWLMQWQDPDVLGPWELFDKVFCVRDKYGHLKDYRNLPLLRDAMRDAWYRVSEKQLAKYLPRPIPKTIPVRLDRGSVSLYREIAEDLMEAIVDMKEQGAGGHINLEGFYHGDPDMTAAGRARGRVMSRLTALRQLCDHPELLRISAEKFAQRRPDTKDTQGSEYAHELLLAGKLDRKMKTPKLDVLIERLKRAAADGIKVVIFSGWVEMLKLMEERIAATKGLPKSVMYHGGLNAKQKDHAKKLFQEHDDVGIFLSSDAGNYGVDLPQAKALINYDRQWSGGKNAQRDARIIRVSSQHRTVAIVDIQISGSVEVWLKEERVDVKVGVKDAVVDGVGIDTRGRVAATGDSLRMFLAENDPGDQ